MTAADIEGVTSSELKLSEVKRRLATRNICFFLYLTETVRAWRIIPGRTAVRGVESPFAMVPTLYHSFVISMVADWSLECLDCSR